jgi:hypothetical protein
MAATGLRSDVPKQTIEVVADAGPPITMPVPRVCCVLSSGLSEHACPGCPNYPEAERRRSLEEWLRTSDDDEFLELAGRARVGTPPPAAAP